MDQLWLLPLHHVVGLIKCLSILFHIEEVKSVYQGCGQHWLLERLWMFYF